MICYRNSQAIYTLLHANQIIAMIGHALILWDWRRKNGDIALFIGLLIFLINDLAVWTDIAAAVDAL